MKFNIYSTSLYDDPDLLIKKYPCLNKFFFEVIESEVSNIKRTRTKDENGFWIYFDDESEKMIIKESVVYIHSLEELLSLRDECGHELVISKHGDTNTIEIYDTWRE